MTYKEYLDADKELNDAYKKAKVVETGTKIVGWGLRSEMVSCYEANYNGKTVTFDNAHYFPDDTIDNTKYYANSVAALKKIGALSPDFPVDDYYKANWVFEDLLMMPFDLDTIKEYLSKYEGEINDIDPDSDKTMEEIAEFDKTLHNTQKESFSVMLGVQSGYFVSNLTPEEAMEKAQPIIEKYGLDVKIFPAAALYKSEWGCPDGGEVGVILEGKVDASQKKTFEEMLSNIMAELGQITSTVEYATPDGSRSSTYIQNTYAEGDRSLSTKEKTEYTPSNADGVHFTAHIVPGINAENRIIDQINSVDTNKDYAITGVCKYDGYEIIYQGSQNPIFAPDTEKYLQALKEQMSEFEIDECFYEIEGNKEHSQQQDLQANKPAQEQNSQHEYIFSGDVEKATEYIDKHPEEAKEIAEKGYRQLDKLSEEIKAMSDKEWAAAKDEIDKTKDSLIKIIAHAETTVLRDEVYKTPLPEDKVFQKEEPAKTPGEKPKTIDELLGIAKTMAENDKKDSQGNDDKKPGQKKDEDGPGGL